MNILAVIPARGGSKGIPRKNIKHLGGKPLLAYTTEIAQKAQCFQTIALTSDDDEIIAVGKSLGVEVPYKRPPELAEDKTPTLPVIQHLLAYYKEQGITYDAVCLLQVTSPFRTVVFVKEAINRFKSESLDSLVSVQEVPHEYNPHWTFFVDPKNHLKIATSDEQLISRRQDLPKAYHRDGQLYLTKTEVILKDNSLYGATMGYIVSDPETYVNLDTPEDWARAEKMVKTIN